MTISKPSAGSSAAISGKWALAPKRSSVGFRVRLFYGLITVTGYFDDYSGRLDLSASPAIKLTMKAASVQTGNRKRDQHLRSSDFFDAENHPHVRFDSDSVRVDGDMLEVSGRLSARGKSIPLRLDAQMRHDGGELEIEAVTSAPHSELGMTWNAFGLIPARSELFVTARLTPVRHVGR